MTIFFRSSPTWRSIARRASTTQLLAPLLDAYYAPDALTGDVRARSRAWLRRYAAPRARAKALPTPSAARA